MACLTPPRIYAIYYFATPSSTFSSSSLSPSTSVLPRFPFFSLTLGRRPLLQTLGFPNNPLSTLLVWFINYFFRCQFRRIWFSYFQDWKRCRLTRRTAKKHSQ